MSAEKNEPRKATVPELLAAGALLLAAVVLTGSVVKYRLDAKPASAAEVDPLTGTMLTPTVAKEGVTYTPGPDLLFIDTTPEGAEARLDGVVLGATPFSSNLSCGDAAKAELTVKKAGFRPVTVEVECGRGTARASLSLKKQ